MVTVEYAQTDLKVKEERTLINNQHMMKKKMIVFFSPKLMICRILVSLVSYIDLITYSETTSNKKAFDIGPKKKMNDNYKFEGHNFKISIACQVQYEE